MLDRLRADRLRAVIGELAGTVGLGFRAALADELLAVESTAASFLEFAPENHLGVGGQRGRRLAAAAERWPLVGHGLCGDFAGAAPVDDEFLDALRADLHRRGARWYSDHLCYTHVDGVAVHDLLPLPHTEEAVERVSARIREVSGRLGLPVAIENISAYVRAPTPPGVRVLDELEFVRSVVEAADCLLLLDVNNVYVNAINFGFDPFDAVCGLPLDRVVQLHIAGHHVEERAADGNPRLLIDTHGAPIVDPVYDLLARTLARMHDSGLVLPPVLLERDHAIPPLVELEHELRRLRRVVDEALVAPQHNTAAGGAASIAAEPRGATADRCGP
jgi:uncharacterized protein (UPF0276 family)